MAKYDYLNGKIRIEEILDNDNEIEKPKKIPSEQEFSFDNGYYSWVTALFVDIKDSTQLFSNPEKIETSKTIRAFTSEVIEILRHDPNIREKGIRGDCVYAIYASSTKESDYEIANKAFYINTLIVMLNKLLEAKNMNTIEVGIGVSTAKELVVKAGRKGSGIKNLVWIGKAVTYASHFSSMGSRYIDDNNPSKGKYRPIIFSKAFYDNIKEKLDENNKKNTSDWFNEYETTEYGTIYDCNVTQKDMNNWIKNGMEN